MHQVEGALAGYLHEEVLRETVLEQLIADVRREAEVLLVAPTKDVSELESQLKTERDQVQRLIRLAAQTGDELGMIAEEIQNRSIQIKSLATRLDTTARRDRGNSRPNRV